MSFNFKDWFKMFVVVEVLESFMYYKDMVVFFGYWLLFFRLFKVRGNSGSGRKLVLGLLRF